MAVTLSEEVLLARTASGATIVSKIEKVTASRRGPPRWLQSPNHKLPTNRGPLCGQWRIGCARYRQRTICLFHQPRRDLGQSGRASLQCGFTLINQNDGMTGLCCELGDAGAHGAGTDNTNGGRSVCMGRSSYFSCMDIQEELQASADYLRERGVGEVDVAIVLGTGLGGLVSEIDEVLAFNYSQIPHIPVATVEFHFGKLIYGELGGKRVLAWQGRFHYYEGYTMEQVVKPVRISKMLGVQKRC